MRSAMMALALVMTAAASVSGQPAAAPVPAAAPPLVAVKTLPDFAGEFAIWGSTGVDAAGHVWFGVTSNDDTSASAHLFEYDPDADTFTDRGNVVAELERAGLKGDGEKQMKIHSRIVQMPDGYLYFSSMDETGEKEDGTKPPTWGGHLWRLRKPGLPWEHLLAAPEALIAVAGGGHYVYALGYWNHVLYQFDTRTKKVRSLVVGSVGGHISRNFFADDRGHVWVPRLTRTAAAVGSNIDVALVEFDENLNEIASTPLKDYLNADPSSSQGIVGISPDGGRGWFALTGKGRLYHVAPGAAGPAPVTDLGWFHPAGSRYAPSLFRDPATGVLFAAAEAPQSAAHFWEWVTHPPSGDATAAALRYGEVPRFPGNALLYGSMARDRKGRYYVVGLMQNKPIVLQVTPSS